MMWEYGILMSVEDSVYKRYIHEYHAWNSCTITWKQYFPLWDYMFVIFKGPMGASGFFEEPF